MLSLLAEVADERPLLCVIDDAQWLDQSRRRPSRSSRAACSAEPVGLVFAVREPSDGHELDGLPELVVGG